MRQYDWLVNFTYLAKIQSADNSNFWPTGIQGKIAYRSQLHRKRVRIGIAIVWANLEFLLLFNTRLYILTLSNFVFYLPQENIHAQENLIANVYCSFHIHVNGMNVYVCLAKLAHSFHGIIHRRLLELDRCMPVGMKTQSYKSMRRANFNITHTI